VSVGETNILRDFQKQLETKISVEMDFARSLIKHNGERGRMVELVFQKLLEKHLPEGFGTVTGFAVDQNGSLSKQIDLIIYDKSTSPFLMNDGVSVLPVEAVISAIEVKTKLDKAAFEDTREKARSLMALERSAYVLQEYPVTTPFNERDGRHLPLFIGVSLDAVDMKKLLSQFKGQEIEPLFVSMDGRCLLNGVHPDGSMKWTYEVDNPGAMFILLASMMTSQARMVPIDFTKYLNAMPKP
jgi:hypothetical protein